MKKYLLHFWDIFGIIGSCLVSAISLEEAKVIAKRKNSYIKEFIKDNNDDK